MIAKALICRKNAHVKVIRNVFMMLFYVRTIDSCVPEVWFGSPLTLLTCKFHFLQFVLPRLWLFDYDCFQIYIVNEKFVTILFHILQRLLRSTTTVSKWSCLSSAASELTEGPEKKILFSQESRIYTLRNLFKLEGLSLIHNPHLNTRYTYRVLQRIQMKLILLCVWAEPAVLGSTKTALKFNNEI